MNGMRFEGLTLTVASVDRSIEYYHYYVRSPDCPSRRNGKWPRMKRVTNAPLD